MPRGFLVKRTKKAGPASYRVRLDEEPQSVITSTWVQERASPSPPACSVRGALAVPAPAGMPEALCAPSCSPNRPVSCGQLDPGCLDRTFHSSSPVVAESFPTLSAFPSLSFLPEVEARLGSICSRVQATLKRSVEAPKLKAQAVKRPKAEKKQSSRDDVTTSPVLGLQIKAAPEEDSKPRDSSNGQLGEFVCQLCREQYVDPLSLAQHKCSRIVRVEYRCSECDKTFSCPANLASHRRWHKPRKPEGDAVLNAKENQNPPSLPQLPADEELFGCPHCSKRFRRQAYLRKHLALHRPGSIPAYHHHLLQSNKGSPLTLPPKLLLAKGALQAAHLSPNITHPCKHCAQTFHSSAEVSRHVAKCHPSETRQLLPLELP
uniref:C2H2-type domain-containing protein n=2 Tax=Latimeria chalumnae TaxID=7897 RepID=H3AWA6_LATCH